MKSVLIVFLSLLTFSVTAQTSTFNLVKVYGPELEVNNKSGINTEMDIVTFGLSLASYDNQPVSKYENSEEKKGVNLVYTLEFDKLQVEDVNLISSFTEINATAGLKRVLESVPTNALWRKYFSVSIEEGKKVVFTQKTDIPVDISLMLKFAVPVKVFNNKGNLINKNNINSLVKMSLETNNPNTHNRS